MFVGMIKVRAEDAWYLTAIELELLRAKGIQHAGGMVDVMKCLDQIPRKLVMRIGLLQACRYVSSTLTSSSTKQIKCTIPLPEVWEKRTNGLWEFRKDALSA